LQVLLPEKPLVDLLQENPKVLLDVVLLEELLEVQYFGKEYLHFFLRAHLNVFEELPSNHFNEVDGLRVF